MDNKVLNTELECIREQVEGNVYKGSKEMERQEEEDMILSPKSYGRRLLE